MSLVFLSVFSWGASGGGTEGGAILPHACGLRTLFLVDVSDIFYFFLLGGGEGESKSQGKEKDSAIKAPS